MRAVQRSAGVAIVTAIVAFASCREPTQITVRVTTDADCPAGDLRPRLNDIVILTGKEIVVGQPGAPQPAPAVNAETDHCETASGTNLVGTLVLLPGDGDSRTVDVLIAAGVQRDATDDESSATAGQCASDVFNGISMEGRPCIIARRRLTFVDHNSLVLPIALDRRCIGEDCGSDLTCYQGNCVDPNVDCAGDAAECAPPGTCPGECENECPSGNGECNGGKCDCLPCEPSECIGNPDCDQVTEVGLCSEDLETCGCAAVCNDAECMADGGVCEGAECVKECSGDELCPCNPDECPSVCESGTCSCSPQCTEGDCNEPWEASDCPETCGPSVCSCHPDECANFCRSRSLPTIGCSTVEGQNQCLCDETSGSGGGGGFGGAPTTTSNGMGGLGGFGGTSTTTSGVLCRDGSECPDTCVGPGSVPLCLMNSCYCTCSETLCVAEHGGCPDPGELPGCYPPAQIPNSMCGCLCDDDACSTHCQDMGGGACTSGPQGACQCFGG